MKTFLVTIICDDGFSITDRMQASSANESLRQIYILYRDYLKGRTLTSIVVIAIADKN